MKKNRLSARPILSLKQHKKDRQQAKEKNATFADKKTNYAAALPFPFFLFHTTKPNASMLAAATVPN